MQNKRKVGSCKRRDGSERGAEKLQVGHGVREKLENHGQRDASETEVEKVEAVVGTARRPGLEAARGHRQQETATRFCGDWEALSVVVPGRGDLATELPDREAVETHVGDSQQEHGTVTPDTH